MAKNKGSGTTNDVTEHQAHLDQLIATKKAALAPEDGRLQVALAIAGVSSLVTVDATQHPFETDPDDLFDRTFNDSKVGLSDEQMPAFKGILSRHLPQIADDISQIPENAALPIEKVAELVRVSLLAHGSDQ